MKTADPKAPITPIRFASTAGMSGVTADQMLTALIAELADSFEEVRVTDETAVGNPALYQGSEQAEILSAVQSREFVAVEGIVGLSEPVEHIPYWATICTTAETWDCITEDCGTQFAEDLTQRAYNRAIALSKSA